MTKRICHLITSLVFVVCLTGAGRAQSPQETKLDQLRKEIQEFEAIARDPSVPSLVGDLNNQLLRSRRAQLSKMLQQEIEALNSYLKRVSFIPPEEKKRITDHISELEKERQSVVAAESDPADPNAKNAADTDKADKDRKQDDDDDPLIKPLRIVLGFEQVGRASSNLLQRAFLDFSITSPALFETKKDKVSLSLWGNIRFSSLPKESFSVAGGKDTDGKSASFPIKVFSPSGANDLFNTIASGDLREITRSAEFLVGPELRIKLNDHLSLSPIALYGATTPISPSDSASFFAIPMDVADIYRNAKSLHEHAGKIVAFVAPDHDRLLRQYYAGFRFRTDFKKQGKPDAVFDVTFGKNAAVTGGRLEGGIVRLEGFYPVPMRSGQYLYLFGTAMLKMGRPNITDPVILKPAPVPDKDVRLITTEANRDLYRFGVGVDLLKLLTKPKD